MFCVYCGKPLPDGAVFCSYCGKKIINVNNDNSEKPVPILSQSTGQQQNVNSDQQHYNNSGNDLSDNIESLTEKAEGLFDSTQQKIQEKLGITDNRPMTHPYQKLGGWLAVFTYGWLLAGLYCIWCIIKELLSMTAINAATGGLTGIITGPVLLIVAVLYGIEAFLCIRMFLLIQRKDTRFLRFYETIGIISLGAIICIAIILTVYLNNKLGSYVRYAMPTVWASIIPSIIISGVFFALILRYFGKSVRVRTYFGTDDYLRRSIFFRNSISPEPAVPDHM